MLFERKARSLVLFACLAAKIQAMVKHRPWQEELEIVDRTMKAISTITDPDQLVGAYWRGISDLMPDVDFVALSRRNVERPFYLITRASRFKERLNPFTQRDRLPKLSGGILGELAYANRPVFMDDLAARLAPDDPGLFYLQGYERLFAYPQYDGGEGLNVTVSLVQEGEEIDLTMLPMLHWQSGLFGRGTTNLVLRNQLSATLDELHREIQVVGDIQRSLLPDALPSIPGFEIAAYYKTSARAGGDYYDFFPLAGGSMGMIIADVSGHGTPAAVLMAITHAIAHAQPGSHTPPAVMNKYLNDCLTRAYTRGRSFVTAFYGVLDPASRTLVYSRAGHNPPRLVRGDRVISINGEGGLPLGIEDGHGYGESTVRLERGDMLLLYTDGITEAGAPMKSGEDRQLFGNDRLDKALLEHIGCGAEECIGHIRNEVAAFTANAPPADDQTLIALRCL